MSIMKRNMKTLRCFNEANLHRVRKISHKEKRNKVALTLIPNSILLSVFVNKQK